MTTTVGPTDAAAPSGRRARLRADALREIKAAASAQLREVGAGALSLRAVAAAVGMSSPGLYRYFPSRDALLTELIADAYDDLAATLTDAQSAAGPALADRWRAACTAYFDWADQNRAEFSLVFGTPVPGYAAPVDGPTTEAARRFGAAFAVPLAEAWRAGARVGDPGTAEVRAPSDPADLEADPAFVATACRSWARLHGILALGLFGHLMPSVVSPAGVRTLYLTEVEEQLRELGITSTHRG
jgi:AcrR family transcriptional regulator